MMLADHLGQELGQGSTGISDLQPTTSEASAERVQGVCRFIAAGHLSGAFVSRFCVVSSWFCLNIRYGGCFNGESPKSEGTRQKLYSVYGSALEIPSIHMRCSIDWCVASPHPLSKGGQRPPPILVGRMLIVL